MFPIVEELSERVASAVVGTIAVVFRGVAVGVGRLDSCSHCRLCWLIDDGKDMES